MFELRITHELGVSLGEADVAGVFEELDDAARAFAKCGAPYAQLIALDGKDPRFLDAAEQARLEQVLAVAGLEAVDVEGAD